MAIKLSTYGLVLQVIFLGTVSAHDSEAQVKSVKEIYVDLGTTNITVGEIIHTIESNTDFSFYYLKRDVDTHKRISFTSSGTKTVAEILLEVSKASKLKFLQVNNNISISPMSDSEIEEGAEGIDIKMVQTTVSGRVTNESDEGLPGVNVLIKGTTQGTITDFDGNYSIAVSDENAVLVFTSVGYLKAERTVGNQQVIDLSMTPDVTSLESVVVVGYGVQEKRNVSGSIASVDSKVLEQTQSPSFDAALQGRVPGVYVTTNGGQPGGGVFVRIRGAGSINNSNPLYVIDDIIVPAGNNENSNPLATINPNDIESIDILKDAASAAIYGARAANGVVLITTKKGQMGKPTLKYNGYYGIQTPATELVRPMNAMEFAENMNRAFAAAGQPEPFADPAAEGEGTNWIDEVTDVGNITDHQLSISGGTESNKYFVSMNRFENNGIMLETYMKRTSVRVNTENKVTNAITIGNNLMYSRSSQRNNNAGNRTFIHGSWTNLYQSLPTIPVFDDNPATSSTGYAGPTSTVLERRRNQVSEYKHPKYDNREDRILGNIYLDVELFKGLKFRSTISTDVRRTRNSNYVAAWFEGLLNSGGRTTISASRFDNDFWQWDNVLNYSNSIDDHNFSVTLGTSAQETEFRSLSTNAEYDTDAFTEIVDGALTLQSNTNSVEESLASIFGRLTYDFNSKYLLTAALRRDGSSKFGPNNKFGVFPSFTAGWRISDEAFFPSDGFLSEMKIRGGWGQVGSDAIGNFRYLAQLNSTFDYPFGNQTGSTALGVALDELANPDVKWEVATEYNFGVETSFLEGRLNFSAEYYNKTNSDMLFVLDLPGTSGLTTTVDNVGEINNQGLEFALNYRKITGDFTYDFNANLTTLNSNVVDLAGKEEIVAFTYSGSGATVVIREGLPLGSFFTRRTVGIFQTQAEVDAANALDGDAGTPYQNVATAPGDWRWEDIDGDGQITAADKAITGSPIPDFTYGFGGAMSYKQFDLNFQFFGVAGNDILNVARSQLTSSGRAYNKSSIVVDAWSGEGTSNSIPRPIVTDPNQNIILSDHLVEDGSYLRLKTMQLGYNLSPDMASRIGLSSARVYLSGQNLFVITKFTGLDPEVGFAQNNSAAAGIYQDLYPQVRSLSVGVDLTF
ncbi:MAG: TonB-dependent receptor [Cyclobacteriaceae bacterium]